MKIGQRHPGQTAGIPRFLSQNLGWLSALVLVFIIGVIVGAQEWRPVLDGLWSVPDRIARSVASSEVDDLPALFIDMNFSSYNSILAQRERALQEGVYIPSGQDFVTATIRLDGSVVPVKMRLLAGPVNQLGGDDKWSFEVHTRNNQRMLDMQRFYLLDPAINNWLNQWAFTRALEREGILATRYQFVHLVLNGDHRGVYALQEGLADELLAAQGRPEGVIIGFDPSLLWKSVAHFRGDARAAYADPVTNLSATDFQYLPSRDLASFLEVDAFYDAAITDDPSLSAQRARAIGLLRGLQGGELRASEVFDVELYGRFLALVDLWSAAHATSLINLHYYYNPSSARLEPIGFNAYPLDADTRISLAATYGDPVLQVAYVREAARISQPEYLDRLRDELGPELGSLQRAVSAGLLQPGVDQELEPPWDALRNRQEQLRRSLDPVQPVFAYLGPPTLTREGILRINIGNVLNLPVEIVGFDIHGATFLPADRRWLQDESGELLADHTDRLVLRAFDAAHTSVIRYVCFDVPLADIHRLDDELDFMQELDIWVATRVLGLSTTHLTLAQPGYSDIPIPIVGVEE